MGVKVKMKVPDYFHTDFSLAFIAVHAIFAVHAWKAPPKNRRIGFNSVE